MKDNNFGEVFIGREPYISMDLPICWSRVYIMEWDHTYLWIFLNLGVGRHLLAEPYISMVTPTANLKKVRLMGNNRIHLWIHLDVGRGEDGTSNDRIYLWILLDGNQCRWGEHQMAENHVYSWIHIYLAETLSNEIWPLKIPMNWPRLTTVCGWEGV